MTQAVPLAVRGSRDGWAVFEGPRQLTRGYSCEYTAHSAATRLERQRRQKTRNCLCCGGQFLSDGPGNRMCNPCRNSPLV
ncbi:hypothetical protein [Pseudooceanicola algae]|uniref:Uncharacterized protein n=1 Tax=Pseudooceanicola algae TaxID=1537215 RepID=A0A418SKE4_9RHOB|nr:hypothetical protein [Pseudooceanicola algae]QPM89128.1 hypothetical protein PSAL_003390 [Pseudooceanicola algae]